MPGLYIGTRTRALRLLWPQQMYEGASPPAPAVRSEPPQMRLYELTHWLVTAEISAACLSRPAMKERPTLESWYSEPDS